MAIREQFKMTTAERRHRHFSDSFKIQKARELETGKISAHSDLHCVSPQAMNPNVKKKRFAIAMPKKSGLHLFQ